MKIFYDHQIFTYQAYGGISNYFVQLISEVLHSGNEICLPIMQTDNTFMHENSFLKNHLIKNGNFKKPKIHWYTNKRYRGKKRIVDALEMFGLIKSNEGLCREYLQYEQFDIMHPTYFDPYFLQYLGNRPFVLTIYDMINELFPKLRQDKIAKNKKILANKASMIFAISESTKNDIIKILDIEPEKIKVIHLATSMQDIELTECDLNVPEKFILFTGERGNYKNFYKFINACSSVLIEFGLHLVCTANKFSKSELKQFDDLGIEDRVVHVTANSKILKHLYTKASLFVFPSLCEGFGIPVLEAFACGCPVALSNKSSLPEVGGDAAVYFDPDSEEYINHTIHTILKDEEKRKYLIKKGYEQAKKFSWAKTAMESMNAYREIIT